MTLVPRPGLLHPAVPPTWFVRQSWTLMRPEGSANVIVSTDPLAPDVDLDGYTTTQGDLLRQQFPQFEQLLLTEIMTPQGPAPLRIHEWCPPDGVFVRQHQLYWVQRGVPAPDTPDGVAVPGRSYCVTATAPVTVADQLNEVFFEILSAVRLGELSTG